MLLISSVVVTAAQTSQADPAVAPSAAPLAAIARGNRSFARKHYEAALREYESVPSSAGENYAQALYNIGVSYYELWRTAEAIDFYRRAIAARHGHYPRASYALGVAFEEQGQLTEAEEAYRQSIIESRGEYSTGLHVPASHNNLGVMLARLGRLREAQHEFEIALSQTGGAFDDATRNLKLCRSLLTTPTTRVTAFRVSEVIAGPNK